MAMFSPIEICFYHASFIEIQYRPTVGALSLVALLELFILALSWLSTDVDTNTNAKYTWRRTWSFDL